jgi:hypothetical protein
MIGLGRAVGQLELVEEGEDVIGDLLRRLERGMVAYTMEDDQATL